MSVEWDAKVSKTSTCWLWVGSVDKEGYGRIGGRRLYAHRVALTRQGVDIPSGFVVDHVCRTRACVNPDHLRVVTPRENALENSVGIAATNAAKVACAKCASPFRYRRDGTRECKPCKDAADERWKKAHPEKKKQYQRNWRLRKNAG